MYLRDTIFASGLTGNFFSTNPLLAQVLSAVHMYCKHMEFPPWVTHNVFIQYF